MRTHSALYLGLVALACGGSPKTIDDHEAPTVLALSPLPGAGNVWVRAPIRATFSEPIENGSITDSSVMLTGPGGTALSKRLSVSADGTQVTVEPIVTPVPPTTLTVSFTGAIRDRTGNALVVPSESWSFTLPVWIELGAGLSLDPAFAANAPRIAVDAGDVPWVAWKQTGAQPASSPPVSTFEVRVASWTGSSWSNAGAQLNFDPLAGTSRPAISVDAASGRVVVAWDEPNGSSADALHAKRWSGSAWEPLGAALNMDPAAPLADRMLAPAPAGAITAAWEESLVGGGDHIVVKQWSGSRWELVGGGPATPAIEAASYPMLTDVVVDGANRPVVGYYVELPNTTGPIVQVRAFEGTSWSLVGGALVGAGGWLGARGSDLFVGTSTPVACPSVTCTELQVHRLAGASWSALGPVASVGENGFLDSAALRVAPSGQPDIAYVATEWNAANGIYSQTLRFSRFTGSAWEQVGGDLLGGPDASFTFQPTLAHDSTGVAYVAAGSSADGIVPAAAHVFRENR